jgi:hypothetical protein
MSTAGGAFSGFPELVWEYTLYSATAAETFAAQVDPADPFSARLLGLLDGLATIVVFRIVRDQFAMQPALSPDPRPPFRSCSRVTASSTAQRIAETGSCPPPFEMGSAPLIVRSDTAWPGARFWQERRALIVLVVQVA